MIKIEKIETSILKLRGVEILLDSQIAEFYGVQTRDVNKAVTNNPDKFPKGYIFEVTKDELKLLQWKNSTTKLSKTRVLPKAFTEKGLYMLATILKSKKATQTTIQIIEAFAQIKELKRNLTDLNNEQLTDKEKNKLSTKTSNLLSNLLEDNNLQTKESETTIELNLALLKIKKTISKK